MKVLTALCMVLCIATSSSMQTSQSGGFPISVTVHQQRPSGNANSPQSANTATQTQVPQNQMPQYQQQMPQSPMDQQQQQQQQQQQYRLQPAGLTQLGLPQPPPNSISRQPSYQQSQSLYQQSYYQPQPPPPPQQQPYNPQYSQLHMQQPPPQPYGQQVPYGQQTYTSYGQQTYTPYGQQTYTPYGQQTYNPYSRPSYNPYVQHTLNPYGQQRYNPWSQPSYGGNQAHQPGRAHTGYPQRQQSNNFLNYLFFDPNPQDMMMVQSGLPPWFVFDMNPVEAAMYDSITRNQPVAPSMGNRNYRAPATQTQTTTTDLFSNPLWATALML